MKDLPYSKIDCCGCKMCGDICPQNAISFEIDMEGFWYPNIDKEKCNSCGRCEKHCPVNNETTNPSSFEPDVYCSWILDEEARINSTSGGLYSALARTILATGGTLVSCVWADDWKSCYHTVGYNEKDLKKIRRTKYFQSDMQGIYIKVKDELASGKEVLFCGSPCYNAALLEFLGGDNENLYMVDYICHAINSPKAFKAYADNLEKKYDSPIKEFHFKNKSKGWTRLGIMVTFKNGKQEYTWRPDSPWHRGYIYGDIYTRPSCDRCRFKKIPRIADITLGDFWGIQHTHEAMKKGMSVVCVNTDKGRKLYERTLSQIHSEPQTLENAINGNKSLLKCVEPNQSKRTAFFKRLDEGEDFSKIVFDINKKSRISISLHWHLSKIKGYVKKWMNI